MGTFETPPPTPEKMKKYRKKHNQEPGIKVIHHGLRDQQLPDASHVYGVKLSDENVASAIPAVTKMFVEGHETELGKYIKEKDEKHIPSRLNPNRVTAGNLVNPTRWSEMGVHREQLTEHRDFEAVLALYKKAGFPVATETAAKIKSALTEKSVYGGVCSLHNFETALKALQM